MWENNPIADHTTQSSGRSSQTSIEGTPFPTSPIVAGYGKTQQLLRLPFRKYFAQASRLVHEADAFLFVGYGFNDPHLNATFSEVRNNRRPVAVIIYADDAEDSLPFRSDQWSYNLRKTIPSGLNTMSSPATHRPPRSVNSSGHTRSKSRQTLTIRSRSGTTDSLKRVSIRTKSWRNYAERVCLYGGPAEIEIVSRSHRLPLASALLPTRPGHLVDCAPSAT